MKGIRINITAITARIFLWRIYATTDSNIESGVQTRIIKMPV
ncbi:MAG: hypothetical protein US52_C0008G0002 [candidate division WS6 bacterium GW2011_GWA2_37_6]|uniref:Uncharacterized protein n=1 Tax=candidate division WS6 bacterium GW2011_GWA2_37_6 TaxID=1619087 RepID=A0A0G0GYU7_9BACT|nr:MAG: hypothetical protein US52_C0008G0002 [candidate division WS6 bacterium GW2011_GWA2_37_6]